MDANHSEDNKQEEFQFESPNQHTTDDEFASADPSIASSPHHEEGESHGNHGDQQDQQESNQDGHEGHEHDQSDHGPAESEHNDSVVDHATAADHDESVDATVKVENESNDAEVPATVSPDGNETLKDSVNDAENAPAPAAAPTPGETGDADADAPAPGESGVSVDNANGETESKEALNKVEPEPVEPAEPVEPGESGEQAPPPLPPRDQAHSPSQTNSAEPPPLPPRKRMPFFWLRGRSATNSSSPPQRPRRSTVSSADYDLLLYRLDVNSEGLENRGDQEKSDSLTAIKQLQQNFEQVREDKAQEAGEEGAINWEFWSEVVNDYANVARHRPQELSNAIAHGFPGELRGLIWQLIASSKSASLEEVYQTLCEADSPHEKAIKRDLSRTSFSKAANSASLHRVIKSYSLFDPEVGYTQGMAFVVTPLLLNMAEPEAFCLLVRLMKDYDLRSLYLPEMPGLHLRLYQFDRILEDTLPDVHIHLARQGVRSSMYASQWFLTLFAYKFPLPLVLRILDIIIAEGVEAILRFGVALMRKNSATILSLGFDDLLTFVKEKVFDVYLLDPSARRNSASQYLENDLVHDAYEVKVLPVTLRKYESEYAEIHRIERERLEEVESLRQSNGQLTLQVRRLEASLAALNTEHIQVANEMVQGKLEIARLQDENEEMTVELQELKDATKDESLLADRQLRKEMEQVREENSTLQEGKKRLEEQLNNLEKELVDAKMRLATLDDENAHLKTRWNELRKHIGAEFN
uniref:ARAD1D23628p n=1 Tax=Blastobotrys adeninivorans TaxID=409370 RepID=A0A060TAX8_BLAAD